MFGLSKELTAQVEKRSSQFYKVMKKSLKIKGDDILVITDHGFETNNLSSHLGYGYYHAAKNKGCNVN